MNNATYETARKIAERLKDLHRVRDWLDRLKGEKHEKDFNELVDLVNNCGNLGTSSIKDGIRAACVLNAKKYIEELIKADQATFDSL